MNTQEYTPFLHLYAVMNKPEITGLVKNYCIEEELQTIDQTYQDWETATGVMRTIEKGESGRADNNVLYSLNPNPKIDKIKENPLFKNSFSNTRIEFKMIDVDDMVAPQRHVSLTHVDELTKKIPDNPSEDELIDICISPQQDVPTPKVTQGPNGWIFSSPSVDFRFLGAYLKDKITEDDLKHTSVGGLPISAITFFVGYGAGSISVFYANNRLILNNGFHRVYALKKKGITRIPVVVQMVGNTTLEFPKEGLLNLPPAYLLNYPRPVIIDDFFNDKLTRIFKRKKMLNVVRVGGGGEQMIFEV